MMYGFVLVFLENGSKTACLSGAKAIYLNLFRYVALEALLLLDSRTAHHKYYHHYAQEKFNSLLASPSSPQQCSVDQVFLILFFFFGASCLCVFGSDLGRLSVSML